MFSGTFSGRENMPDWILEWELRRGMCLEENPNTTYLGKEWMKQK